MTRRKKMEKRSENAMIKAKNRKIKKWSHAPCSQAFTTVWTCRNGALRICYKRRKYGVILQNVISRVKQVVCGTICAFCIFHDGIQYSSQCIVQFGLLVNHNSASPTALAVILLLAVLDIKRRGYSKDIKWTELLKLYFLMQLSNIRLYRMHRQFERDVRQFEQVRSDGQLDSQTKLCV